MVDSKFYYPLKENTYRVIDGDTVEVTLDLGWSILKETSLRLNGLNTPESRTRRLLEKQAGLAIKDVVIKWLADRKDTKCFYASSDERPKYFGRTVGRLWADDLNDCLNTYLLDLKLAKPYDGGAREEFTDDELTSIISVCNNVLGVTSLDGQS